MLTGDNLIAGKKYSAAIFIQSGERKNQIIVGTGETDAADATLLTLRFDDISGVSGEECYIKIASIDDDTAETVTLSAGIFLQQSAESPYIFSPEIVSIELTTLTNLKIQIKLGEQPIESYDAFKNTSILLYGFYWSKETAVNDDNLTESNRTAFSQSFAVARHTVAKSTAILSLNIESELFQRIEKFALKADIEIHAENIKSETSSPTSQTLNLMAQELPEYLQEIPPEVSFANLECNANTAVNVGGKWYMTGDVFASDDTSENGKVLYFPKEWTDYYYDDYDFTEITLQDGTVWDEDEAYEYWGDYGPTYLESQTQIGFGVDRNNIKSFKGFIDIMFELEGYKLAFAGYRVFKAKNYEENPDYTICNFYN